MSSYISSFLPFRGGGCPGGHPARYQRRSPRPRHGSAVGELHRHVGDPGGAEGRDDIGELTRKS